MPDDAANSLWWWILVVWLTVLGGCVGSFLNVVVYRLPRGESLSYPGSRCPHCGHAIRWYHNIPVLGWILLRGRCWDCREVIAVRYPLVEGTVAAVFLILAVTGPLARDIWGSEPGEAALSLRGLWTAFIWEAVLLCSVLALVLIDRDIAERGGGRFPLRLVGAVFAGGLLLPILFPGVLVHTYPEPHAPLPTPTLREAVRHAGYGALAGCGCGCLLFAASRGERTSLRQSALPALVGPYAGPWVVMQIVTGSLFVYAALRPLFRRFEEGALRAWRWPLLFWLASLAGIVAAHAGPGVAASIANPSLTGRLAVGAALLAAVCAYSLAVRISPAKRPE